MTRPAWFVAAMIVALGAASAFGVVFTVRSRTVPPVSAASLAIPPWPGSYLIVNGGSDPGTSAHLMTVDAGGPGLRAWRAQSRGLDAVRRDPSGLRVNGARGVQRSDPGVDRIRVARVPAPCAGPAVLAVDGLPDMQAPQWDREHLAGHQVLPRCAGRDGGADAPVGHPRPGRLQVQAPAAAPSGAGPMPSPFDGRDPLRGDRVESP